MLKVNALPAQEENIMYFPNKKIVLLVLKTSSSLRLELQVLYFPRVFYFPGCEPCAPNEYAFPGSYACSPRPNCTVNDFRFEYSYCRFDLFIYLFHPAELLESETKRTFGFLLLFATLEIFLCLKQNLEFLVVINLHYK